MFIGKGGLYYAGTKDAFPRVINSSSRDGDKSGEVVAYIVGVFFMIRTLAIYGPKTWKKFSAPSDNEATFETWGRHDIYMILLIQGTSISTAASAFFGVSTFFLNLQAQRALVYWVLVYVLPVLMAGVSYFSEYAIGGGSIKECLGRNMTCVYTQRTGRLQKIKRYLLYGCLRMQSICEASAILFFSYQLAKGNKIRLIIMSTLGFLGAIATYKRTFVLYGPKMDLFKPQPKVRSSTLSNENANAPAQASNSQNGINLSEVLAGIVVFWTALGKTCNAYSGFIAADELFKISNLMNDSGKTVFSWVSLGLSCPAFVAEIYFGYHDICTGIDRFPQEVISLCQRISSLFYSSTGQSSAEPLCPLVPEGNCDVTIPSPLRGI